MRLWVRWRKRGFRRRWRSKADPFRKTLGSSNGTLQTYLERACAHRGFIRHAVLPDSAEQLCKRRIATGFCFHQRDHFVAVLCKQIFYWTRGEILLGRNGLVQRPNQQYDSPCLVREMLLQVGDPLEDPKEGVVFLRTALDLFKSDPCTGEIVVSLIVFRCKLLSDGTVAHPHRKTPDGAVQ